MREETLFPAFLKSVGELQDHLPQVINNDINGILCIQYKY